MNKSLSLTRVTSWVLVAGLGAVAVGCQSNAGTGTAVGGGVGAGTGAVIGSQVAGRGARTEGALIGAAAGALIGGVTGNVIGREGDKKEEARRRERDREDRYYGAPPAPGQQPAYQQPTYQPPAGSAPMQSLTRQEVILWSQQGVRDDIIIDRIERSGTRFTLTAADETQLRDAGVSEAVIRSMRATANR